MSDDGFRPEAGHPPSSRPGAAALGSEDFPTAAPYALHQSPRYPDPQRSDFQPYSGPYAQPYGADPGYPMAAVYPGQPPAPHLRPPYPIQQEHPQAGIVLALGVVGLAVPLVSFVAWYLGSRAENEIEDSGVSYANSGSLVAGKILGMIVSILQIVGGGLLLIWLALVIVMAVG